jgi:hypothetical protein
MTLSGVLFTKLVSSFLPLPPLNERRVVCVHREKRMGAVCGRATTPCPVAQHVPAYTVIHGHCRRVAREAAWLRSGAPRQGPSGAAHRQDVYSLLLRVRLGLDCLRPELCLVIADYWLTPHEASGALVGVWAQEMVAQCRALSLARPRVPQSVVANLVSYTRHVLGEYADCHAAWWPLHDGWWPPSTRPPSPSVSQMQRLLLELKEGVVPESGQTKEWRSRLEDLTQLLGRVRMAMDADAEERRPSDMM